jgi:hypothetical protein
MIPRRIQGKTVAPLPTSFPVGPKPSYTRPTKLPTAQSQLPSRRRSSGEVQQTHTIVKESPEVEGGDETLQDISSSLSEEDVKELDLDTPAVSAELDQLLVRQLIDAELQSLATQPDATQQAEVQQIMNEILGVSQLSTEALEEQQDSLVEEVQLTDTQVEVEPGQGQTDLTADQGDVVKQDEDKLANSDKEIVVLNVEEKDDDDEEDEDEEKQQITAKFIDTAVDENKPKEPIDEETEIQPEKEQSVEKEPEVNEILQTEQVSTIESNNDEVLEEITEDKFEYIEPEITIERPPFNRQMSTAITENVIDSETTIETDNNRLLAVARRSSVVRFSDHPDNDMDQMRKMYIKTPLRQSSLDRPQAIVQKQEAEETADSKREGKIGEEDRSGGEEEEEVTIDEYPEEEEEDPDRGEEEAARQQVKREKLQLIENIERQIRENLEVERAIETELMKQKSLESKGTIDIA